MIEVKRLVKKYGERTVLDIESLKVKKGEILVIIGPNGSGKSTLLKILSGVIKETEGEFSAKGDIYYLPQQSLPFRRSVRKNLLISAREAEGKEKRAEEILETLALSALADKNATGLSGGECQRLALGRVLMNKGDFLLLDEPSSAADIEGTEIIENAIREYQRATGCGILMTTHSPKQARDMADRIIILYKGEIIEEGSPEELLTSPKTQWGRKFIDSWKIDK